MKLITAAIATLSLACAIACGARRRRLHSLVGLRPLSRSMVRRSATGTFQLTATARMSDGGTRDVTASAQWESSNRSIATISTAGMVTVLAAGQVEFRATYLGVAGALQLSLNAPPSHGTFALSGIVREVAPNERALAGAQIAIVSGPDAGRSATSDANGFYQLTGVSAGTCHRHHHARWIRPVSRGDYRLQEMRRRMDGLRPCPRPMRAALPRPRAVKTARGAGRKAQTTRARRMAEWPTGLPGSVLPGRDGVSGTQMT